MNGCVGVDGCMSEWLCGKGVIWKNGLMNE